LYKYIIKGELKLRWSIISPMPTKRTITFNPRSLNTEKKTSTYDRGIPGSVLGQAQTCGGVKPVNGVTCNPSF